MIKFPREVVWVGECVAVALKGANCKQERVDTGRYRHSHIDGERWSNHRLSYHINVAPIPRRPENLKEGLVLHTCDNKWCIRPSHLYLGSQSQNMKDLFRRNEVHIAWHSESRKGKPGHPQSEETKDKIRLANLGQKRTPEQRRNMSNGQKGRVHPPEVRAKISAAFARRRKQSA